MKVNKGHCLVSFGTCKRCGVSRAFPNKKTPRRYCSDECMNLGTKMPIDQFRAMRAKENEQNRTFDCIGCGCSFTKPKRWSSKADSARYCTKACARKHVDAWLYKREKQPETSRVSFPECDSCGKRWAEKGWSTVKLCGSEECRLKKQREQHAEYAKRNHENKYKNGVECPECKTVHCPLYGHGSVRLCSKSCAGRWKRKNEDPRKKKANNAKRRARLRGARVETVYPEYIFNRDNWTCKICKKKTPKNLMGSINHDNAPTMDHIIPLAKGGDHSKKNIQCACRRCNYIKGDRTSCNDQLALFG